MQFELQVEAIYHCMLNLLLFKISKMIMVHHTEVSVVTYIIYDPVMPAIRPIFSISPCTSSLPTYLSPTQYIVCRFSQFTVVETRYWKQLYRDRSDTDTLGEKCKGQVLPYKRHGTLHSLPGWRFRRIECEFSDTFFSDSQEMIRIRFGRACIDRKRRWGV